MTIDTTADETAMARKRRIEQLRAARSDDDASQDSSKRARLDSDEDEDGVRRKPSLRGIKNQARYEPGVPMTKEELAKWRKEARRVRNRESAAASRAKTKERIEELESQVSALQDKYDAALRRIAELENQGPSTNVSVAPAPQRVSPQPSPKVTPAPSPLLFHDSVCLDDLSSEANLHQAASQMLLPTHDIHSTMILRPTAITDECQDQVSDYNSETEELLISSTEEESSTWDESGETAAAAAILEPLDVSQEGDLTQFLMDTFGNTETTLDDLIGI